MVRYWALVVFDFQHLLGVSLRDEYEHRPWSWFEPLCLGLFGLEESLLRRRLAADREQQTAAPQLEEVG